MIQIVELFAFNRKTGSNNKKWIQYLPHILYIFNVIHLNPHEALWD